MAINFLFCTENVFFNLKFTTVLVSKLLQSITVVFAIQKKPVITAKSAENYGKGLRPPNPDLGP